MTFTITLTCERLLKIEFQTMLRQLQAPYVSRGYTIDTLVDSRDDSRTSYVAVEVVFRRRRKSNGTASTLRVKKPFGNDARARPARGVAAGRNQTRDLRVREVDPYPGCYLRNDLLAKASKGYVLSSRNRRRRSSPINDPAVDTTILYVNIFKLMRTLGSVTCPPRPGVTNAAGACCNRLARRPLFQLSPGSWYVYKTRLLRGFARVRISTLVPQNQWLDARGGGRAGGARLTLLLNDTRGARARPGATQLLSSAETTLYQ
ncbi:hypothetical protein EVAR_83233_1 [Eumeta japonica]|uniref:Uncharacterized protein n=1 Tax=Eumeta variegata TaxID=151549 RepID=A0A4C1Y664_EUMVA|nr:hypothetical protein EVAR_83233_1 [Eumeta japonica]